MIQDALGTALLNNNNDFDSRGRRRSSLESSTGTLVCASGSATSKRETALDREGVLVIEGESKLIQFITEKSIASAEKKKEAIDTIRGLPKTMSNIYEGASAGLDEIESRRDSLDSETNRLAGMITAAIDNGSVFSQLPEHLRRSFQYAFSTFEQAYGRKDALEMIRRLLYLIDYHPEHGSRNDLFAAAYRTG